MRIVVAAEVHAVERDHCRVIPVIDLDRRPSLVANELDEVGRQVGFFQIVGHEVPAVVIDDAWHAARRFFELPATIKQQWRPPWRGHPYGYLGDDDESLANSVGAAAPPDLKESFNIGLVDPPLATPTEPEETLLQETTPWPIEPDDFREAIEAYWRTMDRLAARLMRLVALALGLDERFFDALIDQGTSALRVLNYPDQRVAPLPGQLRAGAHTDYGTLTILRQDDAPGGLEVLDASGDWIPVPSIPDAFVVNIGDLLARWTNDRWRSTVHRVVNPPLGGSARRQSIAFFHNANFHCMVECLATCCSAQNPARYSPVAAGHHLVSKFQRTR